MRVVPLFVLFVGIALLAPLAVFIGFVASNYAAGFWIESDWKLALGAICPMLGIAAIAWALTKLLRRR